MAMVFMMMAVMVTTVIMTMTMTMMLVLWSWWLQRPGKDDEPHCCGISWKLGLDWVSRLSRLLTS